MKGKFLIGVLFVVLIASFASAGFTTNFEYTRDNNPNSYTSSQDSQRYSYDYWHWDFEKPKKSYTYARPERDRRDYDNYYDRYRYYRDYDSYYDRHRDSRYRYGYNYRSYYSMRYSTSYTHCYDGRCYTSYDGYSPSDNFDTFYYWFKDKVDSTYNYSPRYYDRYQYGWDGMSNY